MRLPGGRSAPYGFPTRRPPLQGQLPPREGGGSGGRSGRDLPKDGRAGDILCLVCGRYTLTSAPARIAEQFELPAAETAGLTPRYNIAPGQPIPVVVDADGRRALRSLHWGLRGAVASDDRNAPTPINVRIESAEEIRGFRAALEHGRCLVPADGFFEWRRRRSGPEPHWLTLPDRALFAFAGLRSTVDPEGSVAILTRPARGALRELHDRMPVLLAAGDYLAWLDPRVGRAAALVRCESPLSDLLSSRPVDARVNDVRFDDPACVEPSPQLAWF